MDSDKKLESISVQDVTANPATDDESILVKQTRTRRLFTPVQLFGFTFLSFGAWFYAGTNLIFVLQNGGPSTWLFSSFVVGPGVFCQIASFAELASIMPIAGAQYYWTYHYAPQKWKRFLTWVQGWTTWAGYVAILAGCLNGVVLFIEGVIQMNHPTYQAGGYRTVLLTLGLIFIEMVCSLWAFRIVPYLELFAGIFNFVLFLVVFALLWALAPRNSMDIFLDTNYASGWDSYFVAFNIGSLANIFLFLAFESLIHMGEEAQSPKRSVPRALFWGVFSNQILAFVMIITFGIAMPSTEVLLGSVSPLVTLLQHGLGSTQATTFIMASFILITGAISLGFLSSVSRLTWAWARDGGLPVYFGLVDATNRVPARAVLLTCFLSAALSMMFLSGESYIALSSLGALSGIALYMSYAILLACVMYARFTTPGGFQLGEWNWGRYGIVFNLFAFIYSVYEMIFLPFPNVLPVTATNMNYGGPIYLGLVIGMLTWWFVHARDHWPGPNMKIVEIVLRSEDGSH